MPYPPLAQGKTIGPVTRRGCGFTLALACLSACGGQRVDTAPDPPAATATLPPDAVTYFPNATWRTASPEQVGLPGSALARVEQRVASGTWRGLSSFLVVRADTS